MASVRTDPQNPVQGSFFSIIGWDMDRKLWHKTLLDGAGASTKFKPDRNGWFQVGSPFPASTVKATQIVTVQALVGGVWTTVATTMVALATAGTTPPPPPSSLPTIPDAPAGWIEVMNEPFATDVAEGGFTNLGHPAYPMLNPYDYGWTDTSKKGIYNPGIASVKDGIFRARMRTIGGKPNVFAMTSFPPGSSARGGFLSGRVATLMRADRIPGFKIVPMLWPDIQSKDILYDGADLGPDYPKWFGGELDLPEGNLDGALLWAFFHYRNVKISVEKKVRADGSAYYTITPLEPYQKSIALGVSADEWHVFTVEWMSGQYVAALVDGVEKGRLTVDANGVNRAPIVSMHANWQFETSLSGQTIDPATVGNIEIAQIRQWRHA